MPGFDNSTAYFLGIDTRGVQPVVNQMTTDGQICIAHTAANPGGGHIDVGLITSVNSNLVVGYSGGNITLLVQTQTALTWTDVTGATQALAVQNGYFTDNAGGVTYTLPATAALGDIIKIDGKLGLTTIAQNANQSIRFGSSITTVGVSGSAVGTNVGDSVTLRCSTAGASTVWIAENFVGNWTIN